MMYEFLGSPIYATIGKLTLVSLFVMVILDRVPLL